jgi:hypothetical protein
MSILLKAFGIKDEGRPSLYDHLLSAYLEERIEVEEFEDGVADLLAGRTPAMTLCASMVGADKRIP